MNDLIQRAAAICGIDTPNSDQLAAWLDKRQRYVKLQQGLTGWSPWVLTHTNLPLFELRGGPTLLEALAAAVVEVDRIEREAAK